MSIDRRYLAAQWRPPALCLLLLLFAIAVRFRDFGNPIIHVDEQYYLLVGDHMLHGAIPYLDVWDRKPIGLFLIFAAIRLLPGDGILAYQLVATVFAAATAWLITAGGRRLGASPVGSLIAGLAYVLWLSFLSGRGGQSPVFYNLFIAGAAVLTLRVPALATAHRRRAIIANGAATCLLAGLAIQTKYTPAIEGAFFGLTHLWYLRRAGSSWAATGGAALIFALIAIAPTAAVIVSYHGRGPTAFQAFWFANFASVALRRGYPAAKITARLMGTAVQLSPFAMCAVTAWRKRPRSPEMFFVFGWLAAALVAFAMIGAFFDHYALPLMVPLTIIAAPVLGNNNTARAAVAVTGAILIVFHLSTESDDRSSAFAAARVLAANDGSECPYVFAGDSVLYHLANACLPTAYAFPSTLAYEPERGATGIDEAAEVRHIMARRPPLIVTLDRPLAPWNVDSQGVVSDALTRNYRLVLSVPREGSQMLVYLRRGRALAK